MALPYLQTEDRTFSMLQTQWKSQLDPLLKAPISKGNILKGVSLASGVTVVNHLLGRTLQGWYTVDVNGAATIYRSQPKDDLTLTLTSSAAVIVDLFVF